MATDPKHYANPERNKMASIGVIERQPRKATGARASRIDRSPLSGS